MRLEIKSDGCPMTRIDGDGRSNLMSKGGRPMLNGIGCPIQLTIKITIANGQMIGMIPKGRQKVDEAGRDSVERKIEMSEMPRFALYNRTT